MPVRIPTISDLDGEQRRVLQHTTYNDPMFVKGPPGSGKTHISILRLKVLINEGYTNVLFLLYNHSMYGFLRHIFRKMELSDTVTINTKDKYFLDIARSNGYNMYNESQYESYPQKYSKRLAFLEQNASLPRYNVIVIDECQDFSMRELKLLNRMSPNIIAVGDNEQSVYEADGQPFLEKLPTRQLNTIYRYGKQVAAVAQYFSKQGCNLTSKVTNANKSDVYKVTARSRYEVINHIKQIVNAKSSTNMTIGILSLSNYSLKALYDELGNVNVRTFYCQNNQDIRNYDFDSHIPVLITPFSAKGMEFDCVILVGYNGLLHTGDFQGIWKEIVYVSLTRTSNELYLIEESDTIKEISRLSEWATLSLSGNNKGAYEF